MAQSLFTKHEKETVEKYLMALVYHLKLPYGQRMTEEQSKERSSEILQKIKYHRFLDTHPREVEGRINR
jgi:hypothetical protein